MKLNDLFLDIYNAMPYPLQSVLFRIKAKQKSRKRLRGKYRFYLEKYLSLWSADYNTVKTFQRSELVSLLLRAGNHSEWYSEKFRNLGISEQLIHKNPFKALENLPILEKEDIRLYLDKIAIHDDKKEKPVAVYTSGTTGSPMKSYTNSDSEQRLHAIKKRFHRTAGVPVKNTGVRFSGNQIVPLSRKKPPFWHYNPYEDTWFFSIYHLKKDTLPHYIDKLNSIKPNILDGYPSGINVLAGYIHNHDIDLKFTPDAICTTAEPLTPHIRQNIESAFNCKVYNQYSTSEGAIFITECREGNLHVNEDTGVAEFFNEEGKPGIGGEMCELIVTGFINQKTPLIRYRTGDWFRLGMNQEHCSCGCKMPVVDSILGRIEDYLVDENGVEQGMVSYRTFKMAEHIIKAQIIQPSPDKVVLKIVKDHGYTEFDERFISKKVKQILGSSIQIDFHYCEDIEAGPNGKFKTVIRKF